MRRDMKTDLDAALADVRLSGERKAAILSAAREAAGEALPGLREVLPGRRRRPFRVVPVAAAVCVALALTALAVSPGLREILMSALGSFAPYSQEANGVSATDRGIRFRVVSALSDGNAAQVYFEVQDLTGDRLDRYTEVNSYTARRPEANYATAGYGVGSCLSYDAERRTALFRLHFTGGGEPAENGILETEFTCVTPGILRLPDAPFPSIEPVPRASEALPTGETVLTPGQTPAELEGTDLAALSSYGFGSDGLLHIQYRVDVEEVNWEETMLEVFLESKSYESGDRDDFSQIKRYNVDGTGPLAVHFERDGVKYLDVRYGATLQDAGDVSPRDVYGYITTKEPIEGTWKLDIPLEDVPSRRVPLDFSIGKVTAKALNLTTIGCTIESAPNGSGSTLGYSFAVFLDDGRVIVAGTSDSTFHAGDYAVNHWSFPEPVEIERVTGFSVGQWYVPLENGAAGEGHWLDEQPEP